VDNSRFVSISTAELGIRQRRSHVLADPSTRKCAFEGRTGIGADLPTFKKLSALLTSVFQYLYPEICSNNSFAGETGHCSASCNN